MFINWFIRPYKSLIIFFISLGRMIVFLYFDCYVTNNLFWKSWNQTFVVSVGGLCGSLKVSLLRERAFSFCVANKDVGFHILKLRKFICPQFKCFFNLWGRGGPNWKREFLQWQIETDAEWTVVSPSKRHVALGMATLKNKTPKIYYSFCQFVAKKSFCLLKIWVMKHVKVIRSLSQLLWEGLYYQMIFM
jgi:hypothetical protein